MTTPSTLSALCLKASTVCGIAVAGSLAIAPTAQALRFDFSYGKTVTQQQAEAVELAGLIWSSYVQDDVTVNIHFDMTNRLGSGRLGGATPAIHSINYDKFSEGLQADAAAGGYDLFLPDSTVNSDTYQMRLQDGSISHGSHELLQTTANNKALGNDLSGDASGLDAYIQLDQQANWSYDYASGTVGRNQFDFVSVVLHEIGHSLGFISGLDITNEDSNKVMPTALDMFRYSNASAQENAIDFSVDSQARYLSVDGGQTVFGVDSTVQSKNGKRTTQVTQEAYFARGTDTSLGGDGLQAGHWTWDNPDLGIMGPILSTKELRQISQLDLAALDYIGWQVDYRTYQQGLDLSQLAQMASKLAQNATYEDRDQEVKAMIEASGIYAMTTCEEAPLGGLLELCYGGWWQSEIAPGSAQSVPEPATLLGLLGVALWGGTQARKK